MRLLLSLLLIFLSSNSFGQIRHFQMDTIIVTGSRLDSKFSITRNISIINSAQIKAMNAKSLPDILNNVNGISMNSRGMAGVQSDPSIRGASFEQVLVLVNGIRMNDPQTGHHNMNIPVAVNDIEKVEVLRGQSSAVYGPDAFGGIINIITKKHSSDKFNLNLRSGSFGSHSSNLSLAKKIGKFRNSLSAEISASDGFRPVTDFKQNSFNFQTSLNDTKKTFEFFTGYLDRDFGANEFYVKNWDSFEHIKSFVGGIKGSYKFDNFIISGNSSYKQHNDDFNLSRTSPNIYSAIHKTERINSEISVKTYISTNSHMIFGTDHSYESIKSNTLGDHNVNRVSFFSELGTTIDSKLFLTLGARYDKHTEWGSNFNPSISAAYTINENITLRSSLGRSFRAPTFTELYSPEASKNLGSVNLIPENAVSFDLGAKFTIGSKITAEITYFVREQKETIDWIKTDPESALWTAVNLFNITTQGIENNINVNVTDDLSLRLYYNYTDQSKDQGNFVSKYVFIHPKHQLILNPIYKFGKHTISGTGVWKERENLDSYLLLGMNFTKTFNSFDVSLSGENLTDENFMELRDVPMPGRAIFISFGLDLGNIIR